MEAELVLMSSTALEEAYYLIFAFIPTFKEVELASVTAWAFVSHTDAFIGRIELSKLGCFPFGSSFSYGYHFRNLLGFSIEKKLDYLMFVLSFQTD